MKNYLLYDAGCAVCTGIAEQVESASDGWLSVRSLGDPEMAQLVAEHDPREQDRPRLVMEGHQGVRVLSGLSMSAAMVRGMGLRRALRVTGIVRDAIEAGDPHGRRSFLRTVGLTAGVVGGVAVAGAPAMAASEGSSAVLSAASTSDLRAAAEGNRQYQAALEAARAKGYSSNLSESVAIDTGGDDRLLFTFMGTPTGRRTTPWSSPTSACRVSRPSPSRPCPATRTRRPRARSWRMP